MPSKNHISHLKSALALALLPRRADSGVRVSRSGEESLLDPVLARVPMRRDLSIGERVDPLPPTPPLARIIYTTQRLNLNMKRRHTGRMSVTARCVYATACTLGVLMLCVCSPQATRLSAGVRCQCKR